MANGGEAQVGCITGRIFDGAVVESEAVDADAIGVCISRNDGVSELEGSGARTADVIGCFGSAAEEVELGRPCDGDGLIQGDRDAHHITGIQGIVLSASGRGDCNGCDCCCGGVEGVGLGGCGAGVTSRIGDAHLESVTSR